MVQESLSLLVFLLLGAQLGQEGHAFLEDPLDPASQASRSPFLLWDPEGQEVLVVLWDLSHLLLLVALVTLAHPVSRCQEVHEVLEALVALGFPLVRFRLWVQFRLLPLAFPWRLASQAFQAYPAFQFLDIPGALAFL